MTVDYKMIHRYRGYENRQDETIVDNKQHGVLLPPSQNVIVTSEGLVQSRGGTEAFGTKFGFEVPFNKYWKNNRGAEMTFATADNKLYVSFAEDWVYLTDVNKDELDIAFWWDTVSKKDYAIIAEGTKSLLNWGGSMGAIDIINGNDIGSNIKPMYDFGLRETDKITINGAEYTITGWTVDGYATLDSAPVASIGDLFIEKVYSQDTFTYMNLEQSDDAPVVESNKDLEVELDFVFDTIAVYQNQLYSGCNTNHLGFKSKNTDWTDFSYNTTKGRIKGEGDKFILDSPITSIDVEPVKGRLVISCGSDDVYELNNQDVNVSAATAYSTSITTVKKLLSGFDSGFLNKYSQTLVKDSLAFISRDATVNTLNRIEHLDTVQGKPLSFLISKELTKENLVGAQLLYIKNNLYLSMPAIGQIMIYDFEQALWQPPIKLPVSSIGIMNGDPFYFDIDGQSHWLFVGTSDNDIAFEQRAVFHYEENGVRSLLKVQDKMYTEGYLSENGEITIKMIYDFAGDSGIQNRTISKNNSKTDTKSVTKFFSYSGSFGIGRYGFGKVGFGSSLDESSGNYSVRVSKFRDFFKSKSPSFFEQRFEITTSKKDTVFALIAFGQNTTLSKLDASKQ